MASIVTLATTESLLGSQTMAAFSAARGQDLAAGWSCITCAEAELACAAEF